MLNVGTIRAYAALALGGAAIAWSAIFVRWTQMPGVASAFYRLLFASAAIWPFLLLSKTKRTPISRSTFRLAALAGVFFAADVGLYNIAVLHTTAGSATFLGNNAPLVVGRRSARDGISVSGGGRGEDSGSLMALPMAHHTITA